MSESPPPSSSSSSSSEPLPPVSPTVWSTRSGSRLTQQPASAPLSNHRPRHHSTSNLSSSVIMGSRSPASRRPSTAMDALLGSRSVTTAATTKTRRRGETKREPRWRFKSDDDLLERTGHSASGTGVQRLSSSPTFGGGHMHQEPDSLSLQALALDIEQAVVERERLVLRTKIFSTGLEMSQEARERLSGELAQLVEQRRALKERIAALEHELDALNLDRCDRASSLSASSSDLLVILDRIRDGLLSECMNRLGGTYQGLPNATFLCMPKGEPLPRSNARIFVAEVRRLVQLLESSLAVKKPLDDHHSSLQARIRELDASNRNLSKQVDALQADVAHTREEAKLMQHLESHSMALNQSLQTVSDGLPLSTWLSEDKSEAEVVVHVMNAVEDATCEIRKFDNDEALPWCELIKPSAEKMASSSGVITSVPDEDEPTMVIKVATVDRLIDFVSSGLSANFVNRFLVVFRMFISPVALFEKLVVSFCTSVPIGVDNATLIDANQRQLKPRRQRVLSVISQWIRFHPYDFADPRLSRMFHPFMDHTVAPMGHTDIVSRIKKSLTRGMLAAPAFVERPAPPLLPPDIDNFTFDDLHPLELARQITLVEFMLLRNLELCEFFDGAWNNKTRKQELAPNITHLIQQFNRVGAWVVSTIVQTEDLSHRTRVTVKFIQVANECYKLGNYNATLAIVGSLGNAAVARLKKTWNGVRRDDLAIKNKLASLMGKNYALLRKELEARDPPTIPYLGPFLKDLTFLEESATILDNGMINWAKMRGVAKAILAVWRFQKSVYCIQEVARIRNYVLNLPCISDDDAFKLSLAREPRKKSRR